MSAVLFTSVASAQFRAGPLHLAIGMFDGVHLGHRVVIGAAVEAARKQGGVAAVLTFFPHPSVLFRPEDPTRLIQDLPTKVAVLESLGIEVVIAESFTLKLAQIAAEAFLPWLQTQLPRLKAVYTGENFRFGHQRRGDAALLTESGRQLGIEVNSVERLTADGATVSSTRIRQHLTAGEIEAANALLGYAYFSRGKVAAGKRLGRTLGFPTLNLDWAPDLRPRFGVYAVRVRSGDGGGPAFDAVANYGLRPTVENTTQPKLEVHVLGECPFGAESDVIVDWLRFLRPELKFGSVEELRRQIGQDRESARAFFARAQK